MMKKILFEDALILKFTKTLRFLVHVLPLGLSLALARGIGVFAYLISKRRNIAYKNLRAAFAGEMSRVQMKGIARRSFQNLAMSAVELLRIPDMDKRYIEKHLELVGTERFKPILSAGRGVIFMTAHFGNWEMLNIASGVLGYPMLVLARAQKHPRSDEFLNGLRSSKGSVIVRKGMPIREILKSLKNGSIVGMLSDQDAGRNGVFVKFFGRLSSSPGGAAAFAMRVGAPVFPVFIFRGRGNRHRVEMEEALRMPDPSVDPEEGQRLMIQEFSDVLESKIRKAPDQWLWGHRRWKSTPDRSILILSDGKAGHLNQSLAVLEAIRQDRRQKGFAVEALHSKVIEVRFRGAFERRALAVLCLVTAGHLPFKPWLLKRVLADDCYREIFGSYADVVISCGSSLLGANLLVKHENRARSIVLMRPSFSSGSFDAVIAPEHDGMNAGKNIFVTEKALSLVSEEQLRLEGGKLFEELGLPPAAKRIGLLVGGDTDTVKFQRGPLERIVQELGRYSEESGTQILATSSRRTPAWADRFLKETLGGRGHCPLLVIANESNRANVVNGILGLSDALVVTGESISMVSEAVASGKPVFVFTPADVSRLKPKMQRFLDRLEKSGRIVVMTPENSRQLIDAHWGHSGGIDQRVPDGDRDVLRRAVQKAVS